MTAKKEALRRKPEQGRAKRTLDTILTSAKRLIEEKGTDGFTMAELARQAGISKPAMYRYFPNKQALLLELSRQTFRENKELLAANLKSKSHDVIQSLQTALYDYCMRQRSESFRSHLRAAMHADPELATLDLADSRANAKQAARYLLSHYPDLDKKEVETQMLIIMGCVDSVAHMVSHVDDAEADALIRGFGQMCVKALSLTPRTPKT